MSHFEEKALNKYDGNPPLYYKRYVDDTFLIFNDRDDCELFFDFLNLQHKNIKFTLEIENNDCIPFLDVLVTRTVDGFISTSLYRKCTFSGLYMKFESFVPQHFKRNLVFGLLNRAWKICSSSELFNQEMENIKQLLKSNGFPVKFLNKHFKSFLNKKMSVNNIACDVYGPAKKNVYLSLPYCGQNSVKLGRQMNRMLAKVAPWVNLGQFFLIFKSMIMASC